MDKKSKYVIKETIYFGLKININSKGITVLSQNKVYKKVCNKVYKGIEIRYSSISNYISPMWGQWAIKNNAIYSYK